MINYKAVIIEADQQLTRLGQEPLYAIYPVDGLAIDDVILPLPRPSVMSRIITALQAP